MNSNKDLLNNYPKEYDSWDLLLRVSNLIKKDNLLDYSI